MFQDVRITSGSVLLPDEKLLVIDIEEVRLDVDKIFGRVDGLAELEVARVVLYAYPFLDPEGE